MDKQLPINKLGTANTIDFSYLYIINIDDIKVYVIVILIESLTTMGEPVLWL